MMKYLDAFVDFANKVLMVVGGISVLALMTLATGNVVLRMFGIPYRGAYEIVSFLGAIVIACALGFTQKRKDHIIVDILTEKFPRHIQALVGKIADLAITIFFGLVCWQIYDWGMKIIESGEVSETLKIPFYPFVFTVAIGFAMLSFTAFVGFLKNLFREGE